MTNPYSKSNPNPKKDPTRKAAAQAKKACRKGPTKGPPIDLEDADLPKLPDGTLDFESMKASLGKSDATAANRKAAIKLYNTYAEHVKRTRWEDLTIREVAGENLQELIEHAFAFFANVPVPHGYLPGFAAPNTDKSVKIIGVSTLLKSLSCLKCSAQERFARGPEGHPAFPTNENDTPAWFTRLCKEFCNKWTYNKEHRWNKNPNLMFGQSKIRPIYSTGDPTESREVLEQKFSWQHEFVTENNCWEDPGKEKWTC